MSQPAEYIAALVDHAPYPNARVVMDATETLYYQYSVSLEEMAKIMYRISVAAMCGDWEYVLSFPFVRKVKKGPVRGRPPISLYVRRDVLGRDGYRCRQCQSTDDLQLDHVIPWSRGGRHDKENLQVLCGPCNRRKGASLPEAAA